MDEPTDPEQSQARPAEDTDTLLRWLDLSQAQVSTLLGMSPQAVSKGFKDDGPAYLAGAGRGMRLFHSLSHIGGDRYALAASRLRDVAREQGWGSYELESPSAVPAQEVYASTQELWVISDSPSSALDWEAFRGNLMAALGRDRHQVLVFFLRTLEAAERWAEVLEREFAKPGIRTACQRASGGRSQRRIADQNIGNVGLAGVFDCFSGNRDNRVGYVQFRAGNARTGHDNRVFGGFFFSGGGGGVSCLVLSK